MHANADGLSRLPLSDSSLLGNPGNDTVFNLAQFENLPVALQDISQATRSDPVLSKLRLCLQNR